MNIQGVGREGSHPFSVELLIDGQKFCLALILALLLLPFRKTPPNKSNLTMNSCIVHINIHGDKQLECMFRCKGKNNIIEILLASLVGRSFR